MILCIDCGNTRLKWGLRDGGDWRASGMLAHGDLALLAGHLREHPSPVRACACNVAGAAMAAKIEALVPCPVEWVAAQAEQCGVRNSYGDASQLGADRWAALVAARRRHAGACLVVNAGTATTIDLLDADGLFHGGFILPGLTLMRRALSGNTAQLPLAEADYSALPRNTAQAIASGAVEATLGAIERAFARLPEPRKDALCLIAGGGAALLAPYLEMPHLEVPQLVLEGVALIAADREQPR